MLSKLKADINSIIERLLKPLNIAIPFSIVDQTMKQFYDKGLEEMELKLGINFVRDPERFELLRGFVAENIKDLSEDVKERLRKEITQGVINLESVPQIMKRIRKVNEMAVDRARMIARTEANRALNMAHMDAARQSGLKLKKRWDASLDRRTSEVCR